MWLRSRSQQELADIIGSRVGRAVRQSTISAIKRGEATPRGDIMSAMYAEIGIEIEWWTEVVVPKDPPSSPGVASADESGGHPISASSATGTDGL